MRVYKLFERFFEKMIDVFWYLFIYIHEMLNIYKKKHLYKNVVLTKEQKKEIDDLWIKNYGRKIPYYWHRLYQSYTGKFDAKYFPEYLYSLKLEPRYNDLKYRRVLCDKNLLEVIFKDSSVKIPKTFVSVCNGVYLDENRGVISKEKALKLIENIGEVIVKETVDSSSGRGVKLCRFENGVDTYSNKPASEIFSGENMVVQEKLVAHKDYAKLHESSINTIRVVSYVLNDEIFVAPLTLRIGVGSSFVDNAHAGGIFVGVFDDGRLQEEAYTEYQKRYIAHPDSKKKGGGTLLFKECTVPYISDVIEAAKRLHGKIPMLKFVSWDFMIDSEAEVVLVEANLDSQAIWVQQMANGRAFFGENTEEVIRLLKKS